MKGIPNDADWLISYDSAVEGDNQARQNQADATFPSALECVMDAFSAIISPDSWSSVMCGPVLGKDCTFL